MDKDRTIKELNEINRLLAREVDEKDNYIKKLEQDANKLASDIRTMCTRDIIAKENSIEQDELTTSSHKLILSKSYGNPNSLEDNKNPPCGPGKVLCEDPVITSAPSRNGS